ncbi:glycosyltransferase family 4 protein [Chiayiivirga flava]|uniref:Sugar transferase (PEP-CTERM/EpsH1 system associated) n=1 Tax=Chiayiivirga flava TaxID=659595 RepID=A0A7W8D5S0_9GAMM|nr:glycosyltransferase family 4 protein [Chiayiivirga flava]MBB5208444.1 sugar transferase (PEP-CTERM/EpsH1 system associated) [Chiayiivirga flava]
MRVLFATNRLPGALTRGDQLRAFEHIRHLSRRHAITLLCFDRAAPDATALAALRPHCEGVLLAPRGLPGMLARGAAALFGGRPLQVALHDGVPRTVDLPRLCATSRFDLAHVQLARLGGLVRRLAPLPCVVDLVDALSLNMLRRATYDRSPLRHAARLEAARLARFERVVCAQARAATVCSVADRAAIGAPANLHLVGNGVDPQAFAFRAPERRAARIVFVGNLGYFPNVDAAVWFATQVLPAVRARVPEATLQLVGARPAAALARLARECAGVELVGAVPDVLPHLHSAAVAAVPLRAGSGQQLKLLEAMAAGTPVVATSPSAAAIDARDGVHLRAADDAAAMADAVVQLLGDADLRMRLAGAARAHVEACWTWARSADALERVWHHAVDAR